MHKCVHMPAIMCWSLGSSASGPTLVHPGSPWDLSVWDLNGSLSGSLLLLRTLWTGRKANGSWHLETLTGWESQWLEKLNLEVSGWKLRLHPTEWHFFWGGVARQRPSLDTESEKLAAGLCLPVICGQMGVSVHSRCTHQSICRHVLVRMNL